MADISNDDQLGHFLSCTGNFETVESILANVHGKILRACSAYAGKPFTGLSEAARACCRAGALDNNLVRKCV